MNGMNSQSNMGSIVRHSLLSKNQGTELRGIYGVYIQRASNETGWGGVYEQHTPGKRWWIVTGSAPNENDTGVDGEL